MHSGVWVLFYSQKLFQKNCKKRLTINRYRYILILSLRKRTEKIRKREKTMTNAEKKARELIAKLSTENLLSQWELTTNCNDVNIPTVRGWLMDELEKRNPEAFNEWLDKNAEDEALREYMIR